MGFPIPDAVKKLQVKIKDEDEDVVYIVNEKNAEVINDQVIRFVDEPGLHEILYVKVLIKTGKNLVVLQAEAPVLLRPDLIIQNVMAPEEVDVDEPFNVDVDIQEMNGELGATATVSLYVDGDLIASYPNVQVDPADVTTVVFAGLSFSDAGTKNFSVVISDAVPGEYDVTNNEYSFTMEVLQPVTTQATYYWLSYKNYDNYYYRSWNNRCGRYFESTQTAAGDEFTLRGTSNGETPSGTIDEVTWSLGSEDGVSQTGRLSNWIPSSSDEWGSNYYYADNVNGIWLYVYARPTDGYTTFELREYSGNKVYVYFGDMRLYSQNYGSHMNAQSSVTASIIIEDDGLTIGGSASANVNGPVSYSSGRFYTSRSYCGGFWGGGYRWYSYGWNSGYDYYSAFSEGWMDQSSLTKSVVTPVAESEFALPDRISLENNYPNPFNPETTIKFSLPEAAATTIIIYDQLGREVTRLADGHLNAGYHEVTWNAVNISSGVYFYRLQAGDYAETRKMILLK